MHQRKLPDKAHHLHLSSDKKSQQKSMKISPPIASTSYVQGDSSHSYSSSPSDETEDYKKLDSPLQVPYNLTKNLRYALELVKSDISSNLGASLAHGFEGYGRSYP